MHESSMLRMEWFANKYLQNKNKLKILDVGSYDVNGCYREIFTDKGHDYVGLDMEEGPNVDICPKSTYAWNELTNDEYDVVISGQALEHIEFFWVTVGEIVRVTKKDGLICLIAPNGFEEHRYPVDCWRFFTDGMVAMAKYYDLEILHAHTNAAPTVKEEKWFSKECADTLLIAKKRYEGNARICNLDRYVCNPKEHESLNQGFISFKEYIAIKKNEGNSRKQERIIKKKIKIWKKIGSTIKKLLKYLN